MKTLKKLITGAFAMLGLATVDYVQASRKKIHRVFATS